MDLFINIKKKISDIWGHDGFQKYFKNTSWMFAARTISFITSFFTVAIVARYLGPENLGRLEYARSFITIISVFASLGIDQILYRDLIANPDKQEELLGTAIFTKLLFGALALITSILISLLIGDDLILTALIGIMAFGFVISPIGTIGILFNSQTKAKYSSQITIFLAFFIPALKLLIVYLDQGIIFFASVLLIEALISAVWSIYIYVTRFRGNPISWRFNYNIFTRLFKDSWPLLLASLAGYIYARMDQVMLLHYLDPRAVGFYGVAVRITELVTIIPGIIIASLFPAIINAQKTDTRLYFNRFKMMSLLVISITLASIIPIYALTPFLIRIIFGEEYADSGPILSTYLWVSIAISIILLVHKYLIAENLGKIFLYSSLLGAISNIILNIILIPLFGARGAALGTLSSYIIAVCSLLLFKKSRDGIFNIIKLKT